MRKFFTSLFFIFLVHQMHAQQNINGIWEDLNGTSFTNGKMIIAQDGEKVVITHYIEFNGTPMVEYGNGWFKGDSLVYNVKVSMAIPGWSTKGVHKLKLIDDGKKLSGMYFDAKGNQGPLVFVKKRPKE